MTKPPDRSYYIEFVRVGHYVKVSAVDPVTLTEAVIVGDAAATKEHLKNLAVRKLEYLLNKNTE